MSDDWDNGRFGDVWNGPHGEDLKAFLFSPFNIVRMETATNLGAVAVEPLGEGAVLQFGALARTDRFKQALGQGAKQVMVRRGYRVDRNNVKIPRPGLFTSGTRYVRISPPADGDNASEDPIQMAPVMG